MFANISGRILSQSATFGVLKAVVRDISILFEAEARCALYSGAAHYRFILIIFHVHYNQGLLTIE